MSQRLLRIGLDGAPLSEPTTVEHLLSADVERLCVEQTSSAEKEIHAQQDELEKALRQHLRVHESVLKDVSRICELCYFVVYPADPSGVTFPAGSKYLRLHEATKKDAGDMKLRYSGSSGETERPMQSLQQFAKSVSSDVAGSFEFASEASAMIRGLVQKKWKLETCFGGRLKVSFISPAVSRRLARLTSPRTPQGAEIYEQHLQRISARHCGWLVAGSKGNGKKAGVDLSFPPSCSVFLTDKRRLVVRVLQPIEEGKRTNKRARKKGNDPKSNKASRSRSSVSRTRTKEGKKSVDSVSAQLEEARTLALEYEMFQLLFSAVRSEGGEQEGWLPLEDCSRPGEEMICGCLQGQGESGEEEVMVSIELRGVHEMDQELEEAVERAKAEIWQRVLGEGNMDNILSVFTQELKGCLFSRSNSF